MASPYPTQHVTIILYAGNSLLSLKALSDYQHQVFFPEPAFLHYIYYSELMLLFYDDFVVQNTALLQYFPRHGYCSEYHLYSLYIL